MAQYVTFVTAESDADDLIVCFALDEHAHASLTLLRTPKDESLLPEEERGVTVSSAEESNGAPELLHSLSWEVGVVRIRSSDNEYVLDISALDDEEIEEAKRVLLKMNFDNRFALNIV